MQRGSSSKARCLNAGLWVQSCAALSPSRWPGHLGSCRTTDLWHHCFPDKRAVNFYGRFRAHADIIPSLPVVSRFRNASGEGRAGSDCWLFHSALRRPCKAGCICCICPSLTSSPVLCPFPSPVQQGCWSQPYLPISVVHFVPALFSSASASSPCAAWHSPFSLPTEDAVRVREPGIQQQSLSQWDWWQVKGRRAHPSRHSLLASYYGILPRDAHCMLIPPPSPLLPIPSLPMHSERQQQPPPRLSPAPACNELILFSLQLQNCPGFIALIAAAVCSHTQPQTRWALRALPRLSCIRALPHSFSAIFLPFGYISDPCFLWFVFHILSGLSLSKRSGWYFSSILSKDAVVALSCSRPSEPVSESRGCLTSPRIALLGIGVRSLSFSLWILTTCCWWKKGYLAKLRLPSSPRLSKSPRTCMTRGASWWMSMHVGCWNFWGWGIGCLCLGCLRWDPVFFKLSHCEFAISPPKPASPGILYAGWRWESSHGFFFFLLLASLNPAPERWLFPMPRRAGAVIPAVTTRALPIKRVLKRWMLLFSVL